MTIPRMEAIAKRWASIPPLSITVAMVAASLGVKVGKAPEAKKENNLQDLLDAVGGAGFTQEKPAWLTT